MNEPEQRGGQALVIDELRAARGAVVGALAEVAHREGKLRIGRGVEQADKSVLLGGDDLGPRPLLEMVHAFQKRVTLRQSRLQDLGNDTGLEIGQAQREGFAALAITGAAGRVVDVEVLQARGGAIVQGQALEQLLLRRGGIHVDVLALDVEKDDGPALCGGFLDEDLGGVGLAGADRAEDAEVARQHILVAAAQANEEVLPAREAAQEHLAGEAQQHTDVVGAQLIDIRAGGGAVTGVARLALDQLALDLNLGQDGPVNGVGRIAQAGEERARQEAAQEGIAGTGILNADKLVAQDMGPALLRGAQHDPLAGGGRAVPIDMAQESFVPCLFRHNPIHRGPGG